MQAAAYYENSIIAIWGFLLGLFFFWRSDGAAKDLGHCCWEDLQVTSINFDTLTEAAFLKTIQDLDNKKEYKIILDCELERLISILNLVNASYVTMVKNTLNFYIVCI